MRDRGLAESRPGNLGGARQPAALRLLQADVLGRARPGGEAGRDSGRPAPAGEVAHGRRGDPAGHPRARRGQARRPAAALRDRRTRRLDAPCGDLRVPARGRRAPEGQRQGDRRGVDRGRLRPPLPDRRDRRRPVGQGGDVPDLLLLARLGAGDRRGAAAGTRPDGAPAPRSPRRSASTRRSSTPRPGGTSATSRRRSPTSR